MYIIDQINALNPSYPEPTYTIERQIQALLEGRKMAVMIVPGNIEPIVPDTIQVTKTDIGTFYHHPYIDPSQVEALVSLGLHGSILGYRSIKSPDTTRVVVAKDEQGREIHLALCLPDDVEDQKRIFMDMYPECSIEEGGEELAILYLKKRIEHFNC